MAKKKIEKATKDTQLAIRLTDDELRRIDHLATALAALVPGSKTTRTSAIRAAMLRGLDQYEADARRTRGGGE